ncbi:uncharacterized protein B0I36DRAFT_413603, partial [Microdochium trichocladiopsis]
RTCRFARGVLSVDPVETRDWLPSRPHSNRPSLFGILAPLLASLQRSDSSLVSHLTRIADWRPAYGVHSENSRAVPSFQDVGAAFPWPKPPPKRTAPCHKPWLLPQAKVCVAKLEVCSSETMHGSHMASSARRWRRLNSTCVIIADSTGTWRTLKVQYDSTVNVPRATSRHPQSTATTTSDGTQGHQLPEMGPQVRARLRNGAAVSPTRSAEALVPASAEARSCGHAATADARCTH